MKETTVAAIDLGASSGRVIVGRYGANGLELTETHRFSNGFRTLNRNSYWEVGNLFNEVKQGLSSSLKAFPELRSCGVDTWAVDHAMLNKAGRLAFPVHAYRDTRTEAMFERIQAAGEDRSLYEWTGLPLITFNTGLQLAESIEAFPQLVEMVDRVLFLPDYFNFLLSGEMVNEFSVVSSSQLLDVRGTSYSEEALKYFGVPRRWFSEPECAGRLLGPVSALEAPGELQVALVPGHDTSCAFEAIPGTGGEMIVSSGTWLLAGARTPRPLLGDAAFELGISNERCGDGGYRPCKNLMGLWLLEQLLPLFEERPASDSEWTKLIAAAGEVPPPDVLIETSAPAFFNPANMQEAIDRHLRDKGAPAPESLAGYTRLICDSLAHSMAETKERYETIYGERFERIVIVGGGSKNQLLCRRTAEFAGVPVVSYQLEGTSVGNIGYQLLALGAVESMDAFREAITPALSAHTYEP